MLQRLQRLSHGQLELVEGTHRHRFGDRHRPASPPRTCACCDPQFYRQVIFGGDLGAAESYLRGHWQTEDLVSLFRLLVRNQDTLQQVSRGAAWLVKPAAAVQRWLTRNTPAGSRKNIHAHYDLGNEFFALFLDETMTYSSGVFPHPHASLKEASIEKYDRICRKLRLQPQHHVIEIGTGWGGFAQHAAEHYGCRVTGTTISEQQYVWACQRIEQRGLADRVTLMKRDYRQLEGQFDRLVSVEMIEAVGHEFLPTYFQTCASLLRDGGEMVIQAITIPDQRYDRYRRSVDFIQRYIFPGGCLPSLGAISQAVATTRDLRLVHLEDFSEHYADTLAAWRSRFWTNVEAIRQLGLDERFVRMWDYYLAYCEAGFRERMTGVSQLHWVRGLRNA